MHASGKDGQTISVPYDRLILATGSNPSCCPSPARFDGVLAYRDIADTQAMIDAAAAATPWSLAAACWAWRRPTA